MQTITIYEKDIIQAPNGIPKKLSDITQEEKKNTSCIIFALKNTNPYVLFFPNVILRLILLVLILVFFGFVG